MLRFRDLERMMPYKDQVAAVQSKLYLELKDEDFEIILLDFGRAKEIFEKPKDSMMQE